MKDKIATIVKGIRKENKKKEIVGITLTSHQNGFVVTILYKDGTTESVTEEDKTK